jgi:hypothetical protein
MRIGLVSDTHAEDDLASMPPEIADTFAARGVQLILHLGDIYSLRVLDVLERVAPVVAVRDFTEPRGEDPRLAHTTRVLDVGGKWIAMVHDLGWPGPRIVADTTLRFPDQPPLPEVLRRKFGRAVDIVAFGHTHEELVETHMGVWFINPGSPTRPGGRHRRGELGTVGIVDISTRGAVSAGIVKLRGRSGAWR